MVPLSPQTIFPLGQCFEHFDIQVLPEPIQSIQDANALKYSGCMYMHVTPVLSKLFHATKHFKSLYGRAEGGRESLLFHFILRWGLILSIQTASLLEEAMRGFTVSSFTRQPS